MSAHAPPPPRRCAPRSQELDHMTKPLPTGETPLAHYLLYWWLDNAVLVNVDGSMALGWRVETIDPACRTNNQLNISAEALRRALNLLPAGYHFQWLRRASPLGPEFYDAFAGAIRTDVPLALQQRTMAAATLQRHQLRRLETYAVLVKPQALGRFGSPASDGASRLFNRLFQRQDPLALTMAQHDSAKRELISTSQSLAEALGPTGARLLPLDGQGLLGLITRFINPSLGAGDVPQLADALPPANGSQHQVLRHLSLREQVLQTSASWDLDTLSIDDPLRPHRVLAMKELPRTTRVDLATGFSKIPCDHWLCVALTALDTQAREGRIERRRNAAFASARGRFTRNAKADAEFQELESALDQMAKRDQRLFELSLHVLLGAENVVELDDRTRNCVETTRSATKLTLQSATYAQLQGWLGMMPGASHTAPHRRVVLTDNAADVIPLYSSSPGAARPLFVLSHRTGEPYALDLANPKKHNWNTNIFGASGRGKSFLTSALISSTITGQGSPLIVIDVGGRDAAGNIIGSYHRLCELAGGEYFEFSLDGKNAVNPFMPRAELYADDRGEPTPQPHPLRLKFLTGVLELLVRNDGEPPLNPVQVAILQEAVVRAYDRWAKERTPLLQDLVPELQGLGNDRADSATAKAYAKTLQAWIQGPYGALLNSPSRIRPKSAFTVFDMKGLEDLGRLAPVLMLILTSYVWAMIARPRKGLAWVIYDETWKLLSDPTAARLQEELYRTARKLNAGVISVTQRLDDFLASPSAQAVVANAENTFLLGHTSHHEAVAKLLGLNPRELALFKSLETRKGFFSEVLFKPSEGSVDAPAVLRYYAGPLDYWQNTTDPVDRALEQEVLRATHGDRASALRELATRYPNGAVAGGFARKEATP
jgi:hypothetical protein